MSIKLYGDPGSGSLRRVTAAAAIMGVDIERINVDLFKGESHTPEFLKLNPHGLTPVLQDGNAVIWEASAINLYLAEKANSNLLGRTSAQKFEVLQWMFWSGEQWRVFSTFLFNEWAGKTLMGKPPTDAVVELAMSNIRNAAKVLDAHLATRKFIVGEDLTLADIDIAAPFSQYQRTGAPFDEFPNLMAWQQRLLDTVPAWAATRDEVETRMGGVVEALG
ncbi:glutathione S-transferase family protein [Pseudomonas petrae]|uniref:glutathione S-transferase family protein n=1 Tax=Pseudomonas petrae TaxID=2912190 RepID=UPI001EEFAE7F|nr:glutathione S-transferase family protein [Pseudomonas petrae]MCF7533649.1 glutathione S-transferase family protein [Pseudomonas petrae]MCF7539633.1 glutathione S-transferase family protein [Pseudomonas petrae]MCF7558078.1 glutathione S-transferase family protein [Pseudomonas petrae]